jgi:hypothetical protein
MRVKISLDPASITEEEARQKKKMSVVMMRFMCVSLLS